MSSPEAAEDQLDESARRATDDTEYVVTYFNGVSEEATGLEAVRRLLIDPSARVSEAQDQMQGGTYRRKE